MIQVDYQVQCYLRLIRVTKVHCNHVPLEIVEQVKLRKVLFVSVGVSQTSGNHKQVVEGSNPIHC